MDASRIASVVPHLLEELLTAAPPIHLLSKLLNQNGEGSITDVRAELRKILNSAASNNWVPSWLQIVNSLGGRTLHGNRLLRRIEGILNEPEYKMHHAAILIEGIHADVANFILVLRRVKDTFVMAHIMADIIPAGKCESEFCFLQVRLEQLTT
jgi:hypothetical protein